MQNLKVRNKPMTTPFIITVAITGPLPQKSDNPAVPISIGEQIESTHEAFEAGATHGRPAPTRTPPEPSYVSFRQLRTSVP